LRGGGGGGDPEAGDDGGEGERCEGGEGEADGGYHGVREDVDDGRPHADGDGERSRRRRDQKIRHHLLACCHAYQSSIHTWSPAGEMHDNEIEEDIDHIYP
jgi:hypothetical protein